MCYLKRCHSIQSLVGESDLPLLHVQLHLNNVSHYQLEGSLLLEIPVLVSVRPHKLIAWNYVRTMISNLVIVKVKILSLQKSLQTDSDSDPMGDEMDLHSPFDDLVLAFQHLIDRWLNEAQWKVVFSLASDTSQSQMRNPFQCFVHDFGMELDFFVEQLCLNVIEEDLELFLFELFGFLLDFFYDFLLILGLGLEFAGIEDFRQQTSIELVFVMSLFD